jgi:hypothetical protein
MKLPTDNSNTTTTQEHSPWQSKTIAKINASLAASHQKKPPFPEQDIQISQHLPHRVKLIIPDNPASNLPGQLQQYISLECGGYTKKFGWGSYQNQAGEIIHEPILEMTVCCTDEQLQRMLPQLETFIAAILTELEQETVFFSLNGDAFLLQRPAANATANSLQGETAA